MSKFLEHREGRVAVLTMNRPEAMNALDDDLMFGLTEAFERLGRDSDVGAILLTGAGKAFCAGGDIRSVSAQGERTYEKRVEDLRAKQRLAHVIMTNSKIVIAGVNGAAMGAGLSLALAADFRIVAKGARFRTAFTNVGFTGDMGANWNLVHMVGPAKARELMILNPMIDSSEAKALGWVTELHEDDALPNAALAFAQRLVEGPTVAFGYVKRNLHNAQTAQLGAYLDLEAAHQSRAAMTDDHKEAVAAFLAKRPPVFTGR